MRPFPSRHHSPSTRQSIAIFAAACLAYAAPPALVTAAPSNKAGAEDLTKSSNGTTRTAQLVGDTRDAPSDESLEAVLARIQGSLTKVQTATATATLSKNQKKESKPRKTRTGPLVLARARGALLTLADTKGKKDQYFATPDIIWAYDGADKIARHMPTSLPVIRDFVVAALRLDALRALDQKTLKLEGVATVDGDECWVIEGKSPGDLKYVGVPVVTMKVWVSRKDGLPRRITIPKERDTVIELRQVSVNPVVTPEQLSWKPPADADQKNLLGF